MNHFHKLEYMAQLVLDGSSFGSFVGFIGGGFSFIEGQEGIDGRLCEALYQGLRDDNSSLKDLSLVAVGRGPGSHTGTRSVAALGKGLAMALGIPWKLFPSLLLHLPEKEGVLGAFIETKQGAFHLCMYHSLNKEVLCNQELSKEDFDKRAHSVEHWGEPSFYTLCHVETFLQKAPLSSLGEPLDYLGTMGNSHFLQL